MTKHHLNQIPVIIISHDRVSCLRQLIAWLERVGMQHIHIIDNNSTYPELLNFLQDTRYNVIRLNKNLGHEVPWMISDFQEIMLNNYFIVTDPDVIPTASCPDTVIAYFFEVLGRFPRHRKVGFGLKIDDLPDHNYLKPKVISWEKQFWRQQIADRLYEACIDTTFALYRPGTPICLGPAIRTGEPYIARHVPWYFDNNNLPDEEEYYREHTDKKYFRMFHLGIDYIFYAELSKQNGEQSKAKENWKKAIEVFKQCDADLWQDKAEKELAALP